MIFGSTDFMVESEEWQSQVEGGAAHYCALVIGCRNKRFFTTNSVFIGIAPRYIQEGDAVLILFGAISPYVLRAERQCWRLLGSAYVSGVMEVGSIVCCPKVKTKQADLLLRG